MSFISDFWKDITGRTARDASERAGEIQSNAASEQAAALGSAGQQTAGLLDPYQQIGQQGLAQAGFIGDSQAQFDWLQNNPLFQLALENANRTTQASSAAKGRLSAGDTLAQLSNNVLLSSSPLIDRQRQDIFGQLNFGQGIAGQQAGIMQNTALNQANLLTGGAAAEAAGTVGAANAMGAGSNNLFGIGGSILGGIGNPFSGGSAIEPNTFANNNSGLNLFNNNNGLKLFGGI